MRSLLCALLLAPFAASAGVYKCDVNGKVQYQDRPCAGSTSSDNQVEMHSNRPVNTGNSPAPANAGMSEAEWLGKTSKENKTRDVQGKILSLEQENQRLRQEMDTELARLRAKKQATNDPAISTEIGTVSTKYVEKIQDNNSRIDVMRAELAGAQMESKRAP
jgi:hypothetical protein